MNLGNLRKRVLKISQSLKTCLVKLKVLKVLDSLKRTISDLAIIIDFLIF